MTNDPISRPDATGAGRRSRTRFAALGLTVGLVGGSLAGLAIGVPGLVGAQTDGSGTTVPAAETAPATETAPARPARHQWLSDALAPLVTDGTLTQAQADAVIAALDAARPDRGPGGPGGHERRGPLRAGLDAAATALGMTSEELGAELRSGTTLAEVASAKGVDVATVVSALVEDMKAHIAEHVAAGEITQEQADARLAQAEERITAMVNGERPVRGSGGPGGRGGRGGHGGHGGPMDDAPADAPAGSGTTS